MVYDVATLRAVLGNAWRSGLIVADHTESEHWYQNTDTGRRAASVTTKQGIINKPYLKPWYIKKTIEYIDANRARCEAGEWEAVLAEAKQAAGKSVDQASVWGTSAHNAIDDYCTEWIRTSVCPSSAVPFLIARAQRAGVEAAGEEIAACRSFDKLVAEQEFIPLASEIKVWYEEGNDCFAGTVDSVLLWLAVRKERVGSGISCVPRLFEDQDPQVQTVARRDHDYVQQESGVWWCAGCGREVEPKLVMGDWKTSNSIEGKDEYAMQTTAYAKAIEKKTGLKFDDIYVFRFDKNKAHYEIRKVEDPKASWKEFLAVSRCFDARALRGSQSLLVPLETGLRHRI